MNLTRREFLEGALASFGVGAFGGRIFAAPLGWKRPDRANLVFGLVSDTHLRSDMTGARLDSPDRYLLAALKYFREQNVDAVAHCGDMADRGQICELEFHAAIWNKVFPGSLAPDGHKVEKLFVAGNHDVEGFRYGLGRPMRVDRIYPDPEEMTKHLLASDFAAQWERIWGEKYERVWHKTIKGYQFLGRHWDVGESELIEKLKDVRFSDRPLFLLSHERSMQLKDSPLDLRNAVGFFGHWHCSASNWNQIHFFPGYSFPNIQVPSSSSYGRFGFGKDEYISKAPIEGKDATKKGYQGYVVRVYDDFLAIERREFSEGGSLGPDWIMPFKWGTGNGEWGTGKHPFSKDELKKVIGKPQFREGAKLEVGFVGHKEQEKQEVELTSDSSVSSCSLWLKIPLADGNPDSRVYAYEVVVTGDDLSKKLCKAVYAVGVHMGIGHEPNGGVTTLEIPKSELPPGKTLTFAVRPLSSLGTSGNSIATTFKA